VVDTAPDQVSGGTGTRKVTRRACLRRGDGRYAIVMNELLESFCLLVEARLRISQAAAAQLLYKLVEHSCTLYVLMTGTLMSVPD
jgi:hypothetical protein